MSKMILWNRRARSRPIDLLSQMAMSLPRSVSLGALNRNFPDIQYGPGQSFQKRGWAWEYPYDATRLSADKWAPLSRRVIPRQE